MDKNDSKNLRGFTNHFAEEFVIPQINFWQTEIDPKVKIGSGLMAEYYDSMRASVASLKDMFSPPYYHHSQFPLHEVVVTVEDVERLKGIIGDNYNYLKKRIADKKALGVSFMDTSKEEKVLEELETYLTHVIPAFADSKDKRLWIPFEELNQPKLNKDNVAEKEISKEFDVFISHASEDKEFVRELAEAMEAEGIKVWYDNFQMKWGDDLRPNIDHGLLNSKYGIVVFSKSFLGKKKWTEYELNGLFSREEQGKKVILPIWHDIERADLAEYSPTFADRIALKSSDSIYDIVQKFKNLL